jgi:hypothetical protein
MGLYLAAFSFGRAFGDILAPILYETSFWMNAGIAVLCNIFALVALQKIHIAGE